MPARPGIRSGSELAPHNQQPPGGSRLPAGRQTQVVVESQRPERVPFDLTAELHLRFDAVAVAYRKAMRDLGLAASAPIGISAV